jgi:uncharacterized protein (DUF58 family)
MRAPARSVHYRAEVLAAALPPLLVAAERVASTVSQGVHGRRRVGQGETFWQFRRYQPGDSTQLIDWRESAKSQHVYVRETEWEAAQSVWLWRDGSPSMDYRSGRDRPTKRERADLLLLALTSLLVRGGEHVALLGGGQAPGAGRGVLNRIAAVIEEGTPDGLSLPDFEPLPRHGRLVLIGDLLSPLAELKATVDDFAGRGVRGHLLQVLDAAEETFPFSGRIRFEGLEDDGEVLLGRVESVRDDYRAALEAHHQGLVDLARKAGWSFATHRTDRPPETALMALYVALSEGTRRRI